MPDTPDSPYRPPAEQPAGYRALPPQPLPRHDRRPGAASLNPGPRP
jgi:hypothetical protein